MFYENSGWIHEKQSLLISGIYDIKIINLNGIIILKKVQKV